MFYTLNINQEHERDIKEEKTLNRQLAPSRHRYSNSIPPSHTGGLETLISGLRTARAASTDCSSVDDELKQYREAMIEILIHVNAAQDAVNTARHLAGVSITSLPRR